MKVICKDLLEGKKDGDCCSRDSGGYPVVRKFDLNVDRFQSASLFWPPVFLKHLCRPAAYLTPDTVQQDLLPLPSVLTKHVTVQNPQKGF